MSLPPDVASDVAINQKCHTMPKKLRLIASNTWEELLDRSKPVRMHSRVPRESLRQMILELCMETPLSSDELSWLLGRTKAHLQKDIIPALMDAGKLKFLYPEQPNSKFQKYITTSVRLSLF